MFIHARDFSHGLAAVSWKTGGYGYIDRTGKPSGVLPKKQSD
jgi:hypothetical protein